MLEFKVRKVCCLHSGHVLLFASVQRVSSSIPTVMGVAIGCGNGSVESQLRVNHYICPFKLLSHSCVLS